MSSSKLQTRAARDTVPYDHDLTPQDLDEVLACGLYPFLQWKSERFAQWLYQSLYWYADWPGLPEERIQRGKDVTHLLMPESAAMEGGYDPLGFAIAFGNLAIIKHVYIPFAYLPQAEEGYRQRIMLLAQKTGDKQMLQLIMKELDKEKIDLDE